MNKKLVTNVMNEWGFFGQDILWGLESPPQLINLNSGVAWWKKKG